MYSVKLLVIYGVLAFSLLAAVCSKMELACLKRDERGDIVIAEPMVRTGLKY